MFAHSKTITFHLSNSSLALGVYCITENYLAEKGGPSLLGQLKVDRCNLLEIRLLILLLFIELLGIGAAFEEECQFST